MQRRCSLRRALSTCGLALALGLASPSRPARGDGAEETELRLKRAGVEAPLRDRIHAGIRRGARWLMSTYGAPDGQAFPDRRLDGGALALASLALRHAGLPEEVRAGRRGLDRLLSAEGPRLVERTYEGGVLGLLLQADARGLPLGRTLHDRLAATVGRGYWDYGGVPGSPNLSTSQFACLGLWSTERSGAPVATRAWSVHLEALLRAQSEDGSWGYDPPEVPGADRTYPTGTFMGLADLVLAEHALGPTAAPRLSAEAIVGRGRARAALRRHTAWVLDGDGGPDARASLWPHYQRYALEKAAVFLGEERVAGRAWYPACARWLLSRQRVDGAWGGNSGPWGAAVATPSGPANAVDTAFALLVLLRVSESYRPVTPRPVDAPRAVTPGAQGPPHPPRPGPPAALGLEVAQAELTRLRQALASGPEEGLSAALQALRFVRRTYPTYRAADQPLSEAHDAWCREAQALLLDVALDESSRAPHLRPFAQALSLEALEALGDTDARVAGPLLRALEGRRELTSWPAPVLYAWRSGALDALLRVKTPLLLPWLLTRGLSEGPIQWMSLSPALVMAGGLDGLSGAQRRSLVAGAMARLEPLLSGLVPAEPWTPALRCDLLALVRRLTAAGEDRPPDAPATPSDLLTWWREHQRPDDPLWRDP